MKAVWFGSAKSAQFEMTGLGMQSRWPGLELTQTTSVDQALALIGMEWVELAFAHLGEELEGAMDFIEGARNVSEAPLLAVVGPKTPEFIRVKALLLGVDRLLIEPCSPLETQAVVVALLRRQGIQRGLKAMLQLGDLSIRPATCEVFLKGQPLQLSPTELRLLLALTQRQGMVVTYDQLMQSVWGYMPHPSTLHKYICRLRLKLGDSEARPRFIVSVLSVGYRLQSRLDSFVESGRRAS